jgi:hypothetical protein
MSNPDMRAIEAQPFSGYGGLRTVEVPKPQPAKSRVLVRVTAARVTPLDYTSCGEDILGQRRRWSSATRALESSRMQATPVFRWEVA